MSRLSWTFNVQRKTSRRASLSILRPMRNSARSAMRRYEIPVLITILLMGLSVRVVNLGGPDFGGDERFHVFAASEVLESGSPVLPSGFRYDRARLWTEIIALAGRLAPLSEATARAPAVILGVANMFLVFWMTRRWFGGPAGLIAAFLVAFAPLEIGHSRQVRMYMAFQFAYLAFIYMFYVGIEARRTAVARTSAGSYIRNFFDTCQVSPVALLLAGGFLALSFHFHDSAIVGAFGPVVFVLAMGVFGFWVDRPWAVRLKYIGSAAAIVLAAACVYAVFPDFVHTNLKTYQSAPLWAEGSSESWQYYRYILLTEYPIMLPLYPIALVFAFRKNQIVTFYLSICFVVSILILGYAAWKVERFIIFILPLLFIPVSVALYDLAGAVNGVIVDLVKRSTLRRLPSSVMAAGTGAVLAFALLNAPWFMQAIRLHCTSPLPRPAVSNTSAPRLKSRAYWSQAMAWACSLTTAWPMTPLTPSLNSLLPRACCRARSSMVASRPQAIRPHSPLPVAVGRNPHRTGMAPTPKFPTSCFATDV